VVFTVENFQPPPGANASTRIGAPASTRRRTWPLTRVGSDSLLPLLFHAGCRIGALALAEQKPRTVGEATRTRATGSYTLQRVTGAPRVRGLCFHLYGYWGRKIAGKLAPEQFYKPSART
jgi:hypothetical protein